MNYGLAYAVGSHPWEHAIRELGFVEAITRLFEDEECGREPPCGRASTSVRQRDLGVELERRGWQVTGVDNVKRALRRARDRIEETDVGMELVRSDVTDLARPGSAPGSGCCSIRGPSTV
jgi:hypothetical protein